MTTTIKITELVDIGANLASSTVLPVVNMSGTPTTQKTVMANIANLVLAGAGGNYVAAAKATTANTVTTNAQPNITSIGNLTGLTVSNATGVVNFSNTANVTLGAVANLHITGGSNGQTLTTNGSGNLSWTTVSGGNGIPSGTNTQIQFNDVGAFGGNTGFTFDKTTGVFATPFANVSGVANIVGGGATVATKSVLNVDSTFGSNSSSDPASAQAIRGRVTGSNLTQTRNYVTGVTGQYLVTGTNASEFIKAGVLGVVGDQTTTADGAVVAYLDGDGGLTTANAAYAVSMKNSTPNSGFNYGLDLQFISLNLGGVTTSKFKQADIRFNNGVTLVANTAGNISINANVTVGNIIATNIGNIANINLTGNSSNVLYGNGVFAAVAGGANTGNIGFDDTVIYSNTGVVVNNSDLGNGQTAGMSIPVQGDGNAVALYNTYGNVNLLAGNIGNSQSVQTWSFGASGNLTLPSNTFAVNYANGTQVSIGGNTGNVTFNDINIIGDGNLKLQPDPADAAAYVNIYLTGAADIHMAAGAAGANLILGTDEEANIAVLQGGNVAIQAGNVSGTKTWNFDTTGNLTLPLNSVVYETNIPDQSLSGSAIALKPAGGTTANQQLLIYPTANDGDHIHMTSGNLYETELFLGSDNLYVKLANTGNVVINSNDGNSNTAMWTFGTDGNLSVPGDLIGPASANFTIYANAGVHDFIFAQDGTFYAPDTVVLGGNTIYIGPGANTLAGLEHAVMIASSNHNAYIQAVINNVSDNGSADWVAQGRLGDDTGGWADMGFTSGGFGDANYTITGPGDGYLFVESYAPGQLITGPKGGNLILATGSQGTTKDIIFGTGGFLTGNIFGRISHANNSFELSRAGATIKFPDSTVQNTAWTGNVARIANGNSNVNIATANGNVTIAAVGNTTMTITGTGANITGTANISGNVNTAGQLSATGNITTSGNFVGNGAALTNVTVNVAGNIVGTQSNVTLVAGSYNWTFDNTGNLKLPGNTFAVNYANNTPVDAVTRFSGTWTVPTGNSTQSFTVGSSETYQMWVDCNIPNGILVWNATATVTNTNVPVVGAQYAWVYNGGGTPIDFTSIPNQFVGTANAIVRSNTAPSATTNRFDFGINNTSGGNVTVRYGWIAIS